MMRSDLVCADHVTSAVAVALRQTRRRAGLTLEELSRRTGIQPPILSRIESGRSETSIRIAIGFARAVGIDPRDVLLAVADFVEAQERAEVA